MEEKKKMTKKEELELFTKQLAQKKRALENYRVQWLIDKELHQIVLDNFGLVTPTHKYQRVGRYWELQLKKYEFQIREDTFMADSKIAALEGEIKGLKDLIKETTPKKKAVRGKKK